MLNTVEMLDFNCVTVGRSQGSVLELIFIFSFMNDLPKIVL